MKRPLPHLDRRLAAALAVLASLGLAGCGSTVPERALSGGALGAAAGAGVAAVAGGPVAKGALIGGAAGAVTGAVTRQRDLDLTPRCLPWRRC